MGYPFLYYNLKGLGNYLYATKQVCNCHYSHKLIIKYISQARGFDQSKEKLKK